MRVPVRCCALILLFSILAVGDGNAESITYTVAFNNFVPVPPIPLFRESAGVNLYEVDVTATGDTTWTVAVTPGLSSGSYEANAEMLFSNGVRLGSSTHDFAFSYPTPATTITLGNTWSISDQITTGFEPFIGNGVYYPGGLQSYRFLSTNPPLRSSLDTSVFGEFSFTVTYQFTVPEPPAVIMAGTAALAGLAYWLRRPSPHRELGGEDPGRSLARDRCPGP